MSVHSSPHANIWIVIRSLEERSRLLTRMADQQQGPGRDGAERLLRRRAAEAADHARAVQELQRRVASGTVSGDGSDWTLRHHG
ncbi:MAG TPA: hypothetical protein VFN87_18970 [Solirubrobacteraceae bacterium]|nr:hypothetical protein [Solirubrobacteraceae bacterium]